MTKKIIVKAVIVIANILLVAFIYVANNFAIISPQKVHELLENSLAIFLVKKLIVAIIVSLIATTVSFLIWLILKKSFRLLQSPKEYFKNQLVIFLIISILIAAINFYFLNLEDLVSLSVPSPTNI
jgi:hypothetical protein